MTRQIITQYFALMFARYENISFDGYMAFKRWEDRCQAAGEIVKL